VQKFQIAQVNIARLLVPEGDPQVAEFFNNLDRINALAERSDGFVWRFVGDYEPDPLLLFNMSIWSSIDHLTQFAYRSDHIKIMRQKTKWFKPMNSASMALWWIEVDSTPPSFDDALARLAHLDENGPTPHAFTFKDAFATPQPT
jgi:hypothetical protein